MPRKKTAPVESEAPDGCACGSGRTPDADSQCFDCRVVEWAPDKILSHQVFGPAIIGKAQHDYCQRYVAESAGGIFGPALLGIVPEAYQDQRPKAEA